MNIKNRTFKLANIHKQRDWFVKLVCAMPDVLDKHVVPESAC